MRNLWVTCLVFSAGTGCFGCRPEPKPRQPSTAYEPTKAWYRAQLMLGEFVVPFDLYLDGRTKKGLIKNGEHTSKLVFSQTGPRAKLLFPRYRTTVEASFTQDGQLIGKLSHKNSEKTLAFSAIQTATTAPRFFKPNHREAEKLQGVWKFEIDGFGLTKGRINRSGPHYSLSLESVVKFGDFHAMVGDVDAQRMRFSGFDGLLATYVELYREEGRWEGFMETNLTHHSLRAERSPRLELPDPLRRVQAKVAKPAFPGLDDPRFEGKAVLVDLFGTWCGNCNEAVPHLVKLHKKYKSQGFDILSIAYEFAQNGEDAGENIDRFKKSYGVDWKVVPVLTNFENLDDAMPRDLKGATGVPIAIFLKRDKSVHAIYAGFSGPATGPDHEKCLRTLEALTREIIADEKAETR